MNIRAEIVRSAYEEAVSTETPEIFFCCNALLHAAMSRGVRMDGLLLLSIEEEFEELFGDATFWVHTGEARILHPDPPPLYEYSRAQRHIDRINVLDLFATILESEG